MSESAGKSGDQEGDDMLGLFGGSIAPLPQPVAGDGIGLPEGIAEASSCLVSMPGYPVGMPGLFMMPMVPAGGFNAHEAVGPVPLAASGAPVPLLPNGPVVETHQSEPRFDTARERRNYVARASYHGKHNVKKSAKYAQRQNRLRRGEQSRRHLMSQVDMDAVLDAHRPRQTAVAAMRKLREAEEEEAERERADKQYDDEHDVAVAKKAKEGKGSGDSAIRACEKLLMANKEEDPNDPDSAYDPRDEKKIREMLESQEAGGAEGGNQEAGAGEKRKLEEVGKGRKVKVSAKVAASQANQKYWMAVTGYDEPYDSVEEAMEWGVVFFSPKSGSFHSATVIQRELILADRAGRQKYLAPVVQVVQRHDRQCYGARWLDDTLHGAGGPDSITALQEEGGFKVSVLDNTPYSIPE